MARNIASTPLQNGTRRHKPGRRAVLSQAGRAAYGRLGPVETYTEDELEKSATQVKRERTNAQALGLALLAFGAIGWLIGAKYSLIGWHGWINGFLAWIGLPLAIPLVRDWGWLAVLPIGLIYSRVEVSHRPFVRRGWRLTQLAPWPHWLGWSLIVATDVGSTYAGAKQPSVDLWGGLYPAMAQIAAHAGLLVAWSIGLTFLPESLILSGKKLLRRG